MVWIESTSGFRNGLGGIAWMAALITGVALGGLTGGALGAVGRGVRVVGLGNVFRVLLGAVGGAVLGAGAGWLAAGLGNEQAVAAVLLAETAGIVLGMLLLTAPRAA
jgi:hypothetical protein